MSTTAGTAPISSSTPILDRLIPAPPPAAAEVKKATSWRRPVLISLAGVLLVIWLAQRHYPGLPAYRAAAWLLLAWWLLEPLLALMTAVAVHEIGHTIAGKLMGFRFVLMRVGPLQIALPFRVQWKAERRPLGGGHVILFPKHTRLLRIRSILMFLAGPAANLTSYYGLTLFAPGDSLFCGWFALASLWMGLVNLLPFEELSMVSDGKRIFTLLFHSRHAERGLALLRLEDDLRQSAKPEDLSPDFMRAATAIQDGSLFTLIAHTLAYTRAFYKEDADEAARLLEVCLRYSNLATPAVREAIFTDAATFQAARHKRIDLAQGWLDQLPEKTVVPGRRAWIEGAILEAQEDFEGALKKLDESEAQRKAVIKPENQELLLRNYRRWRSELQDKITAKAVG
jgi:hypothetical protein